MSRAPWRLEQRSSCIAVIDCDGQELLFLLKHSDDGRECGSVTTRGRTNEEIDAAALIIAAAPDLLAALRAVVASANPRPTEHPAMTRAWDLARAALSKAGVE